MLGLDLGLENIRVSNLEGDVRVRRKLVFIKENEHSSFCNQKVVSALEIHRESLISIICVPPCDF